MDAKRNSSFAAKIKKSKKHEKYFQHSENPYGEITIQGNKNLMPAELAHQKADKHFCVALHRKVRISYTLLWHYKQESVQNVAMSRE